MKIEVLFPEICNLYGDLANIRYLSESLDASGEKHEVIETGLKDIPMFTGEDKPDMVYMGTTTERGQLLAIEALKLYRDRIIEEIDRGTNFLITGNALEIFGKDIIEDGKKKGEGLGIFETEARRFMRKRFNSLYVGKFVEGNIDIVGYKSLFGHSYGTVETPLFETVRSVGLNPEVKGEGIKQNNFYATYLTGPLFILNPVFMKWYMKNRLGVKDPKAAYEDAVMDAYNTRLAEYSDPDTGIYY